eukprot:Skav209521  [mRNA]  locus=scaffold2767:315938:319873:- [translate_table: standard]
MEQNLLQDATETQQTCCAKLRSFRSWNECIMELFVQHVCPLIKLWKDPSSRRFWCGDRKYQFGIAGDFAAILIIVLVAVLLCCYVFLTISSETLTYSEDGHGVKMQQKEPESDVLRFVHRKSME